MFRATKAFGAGMLGLSQREVPFEHLLTEPVVRLVVRSEEHAETGFGDLVARLGYQSVVFGVADVAWMDIAAKGVNKSTMLGPPASGAATTRSAPSPSVTSTTTSTCCAGPVSASRWAACGGHRGRPRHEQRPRRRWPTSSTRSSSRRRAVYRRGCPRMTATTIEVTPRRATAWPSWPASAA